MTDVWVQDGSIYIETTYEHAGVCKEIPAGRWLTRHGVWEYPATIGVAARIAEAFPGRRTDERFGEYLETWNALQSPSTWSHPWPLDLKTQTPWPHQSDGYTYMQRALAGPDGGVGLFAGMGTGKTLTAAAMVAAREWDRVLIVSPPSMLNTWADTIAAETGRYPVVLSGSTASRATCVNEWNGGCGAVFITNYEGAWRGDFGNALLAFGFDAVILDEAQKIKAPGSKVSKFFARLGRVVPYRIALTGTPAHDKITDVYGIYRFLDPGIFGTNHDRFLNEFTIRRPTSTGVMYVVGYQNQEELTRRMYQVAFRVPESVLTLPESVDTIRSLTLPGPARKSYRELENDLVTQLKGEDIIAGNVLTQLLRLQQVAAGFLPDPTGEDGDVLIHNEKTIALNELFEEIPDGEPIVVFGRFRNDLGMIREAACLAGRDYLEESGRAHEWRTWQNERTGGEVIGVQIAAGSAGIDLTRSRYAIYYSHGLSLGDYEQSRRRILRPGQTRPVVYSHLLARQTVDEKVYQALSTKADLARSVVDGLLNRP